MKAELARDYISSDEQKVKYNQIGGFKHKGHLSGQLTVAY